MLVVLVKSPPQTQKKNPNLPSLWETQLILYTDPKGEIKGFITSLINRDKYPLKQLLKIYWQRWEIEESYGEIK